MDLYRLNILGGIRVLDSVVDAYRYPPHWHEEYVIAVYRGGAKKYQCGRRRGSARAGDLLIIAPGTLHSAATYDGVGWDYVSIYLTPDQFSKAVGREAESLADKVKDFTHIAGKLHLTWQALQALDAGTGGDLALSEWLIALLNSAPRGVRESRDIPSSLVRVYELIMDDPSLPITMGELSAVAGVTPEHLSRSFKRFYGLSPFQLLVAARIQAAQKLTAKGIPLAMAAVSAGFSDQSHMTRWIKRSCGVSPGIFRRNQYRSRPRS